MPAMSEPASSAAATQSALPLRAALWATAASIIFALMIGVIRYVAVVDGMHPFEIAFFRNLFGLAFMLPWLTRSGLSGLKTRRQGLYAVRAGLGMVAMMTWFWALAELPLAEAVALSYTAPIFATVLAALVLGEVVRRRRWTATIIGFAGAMVILRPGLQELTPASLVVLVSAASFASAIIVMKMLSRTEPTNAIVTYMVLYLTPLSLLPALFVWTTPDLATLVRLVILGGLATAAHLCITRAFACADASAVMPFDFMRLPCAALIGYLVFAESADLWTWVGAVIIFGASVYIARRESQVARQQRRGMAARAAAEASGRSPGE